MEQKQVVEPSLKTGLWIKSQIKICDLNFLPIAVRRRGDPDSGAILLKINRLDEGIELFTQIRKIDGLLTWMPINNGPKFDEKNANKYIDKLCQSDPDIWVLEIEDPKGKYKFEGGVLEPD